MAVAGRGEPRALSARASIACVLMPLRCTPAHDASRLVGAPGVELGANVEQSGRVGTTMAPHGQVKVMRRPSPARGTYALPVQRGGKIGVGDDAR